MKKKFLLSLMLICLATLAFGISTVSAETYDVYTYTVSNDEVTITDCDALASGVITIPDSIGGYPVTGIGTSAFSGCSSITSIMIPDSVTSIGSNAFRTCKGLTNINIPDSVTSIGYAAFYDCDGLIDIVIPGSVEVINDDMFYHCGGLQSVTLEDGVTTICRNVFQTCDKLEKIIIPETVTEMGFCAIYDCPELTEAYYGGKSWYNIYDNKYMLHFDLCGKVTLKYFRNVTVLDLDGNKVKKVMKDLNGTLELSDIGLNDGQNASLYTDIECENEYLFNTPIGENLTLYTDAKYTTTAISKDGKTFTVSAANVGNGNTVILALYNNERFVEMQKAIYVGDEISFSTNKSYTNAKIMAWKSLTSLTPVTSTEKVK